MQQDRPRRQMALTEALVSRCHRVIPDAGPEPGLGYLEEHEYAPMVEAAIAARPLRDATGRDAVWLFAYGSLIWKPEVEHVEERLAVAHGFHRSFCLTMTRWRGTVDRPGLMMGLARGGQCTGVALRLPDGDPRAMFHSLFRREMTAKPTTYLPRWLRLRTAAGPIDGLAFVANPAGRTYAGRLDDATVAERLARSCGHVGSGAEYLYNTVRHLEERGIHDRGLWRLQQRVAAILSQDE